MEFLKNCLFELCSESAPSGREYSLCSLERLVKPFVDKCYRDSAGNLVAVKYAKTPGKEKLLLDAHIDEVGLVVTEVDDNGFIHFANHTGIDSRILPASTVTVMGKMSVTGIVSTLPPHLLKDADNKKVIKTNEMVIDIGYSAEKARELVKTGDFITLRAGCFELRNDLVMGKSFDNRASASVILGVFASLSRIEQNYDVYAVFSAGEEFGGYGAKTAAFDIMPDKAIVLDATFGVSPYTSKIKGKQLGEGPCIAISPILDNHITESLSGICRMNAIPYQIEVVSGRTGTNADSIVATRSGVPSALISLPLRYMHSAGEIVSLKDMKKTVLLLLGFIDRRGGMFYE